MCRCFGLPSQEHERVHKIKLGRISGHSGSDPKYLGLDGIHMAEWPVLATQRPYLELDSLTRKEIARRSQNLVSPETTVFIDTGNSWFNRIHLRLPRGAGFEIEIQWGHIGWSMPAAFGYTLAKPKRRVVIVVGDSAAFQMTAQEVSQMVRWRVPITILLINNKGYTIEVEIHNGLYNRIQNWKYASLVQTFNSEEGGGYTLRFEVSTVYHFTEALDKAIVYMDGPTLIEYTIDQDDCSRDLIT